MKLMNKMLLETRFAVSKRLPMFPLLLRMILMVILMILVGLMKIKAMLMVKLLILLRRMREYWHYSIPRTRVVR
uniref:Uncharacterized protein n=1 Tax=Medicago truncatula TaxID=3880 RepID=I3S4H7_MEDTR|nr:unknown [Medicago truncatula]AFK43165.1 unknown [Medicago truncatula]